MDVGSWLRGLGLERYEAAFEDHDITWDLLPGLTAVELNDIGVASLGHRKRIMMAIAALPRPDEKGEASKAVPERRYLTVMFVDLVGSTTLSTELDPEDLSSLIVAYRQLATDVIVAAGGHVAKFVGDGVLAYFGWPDAHENEAERAVQAGLEITAEVARLDTPHGRELAARVGVATGLVVVGEILGNGMAQEEGAFGQTPNLASRLQEVALPGTVIVSAATRALVGDLFLIRPLDPQILKGFDSPVEAFEIVGMRALVTRFEGLHGKTLAPMTGREEELALILERWTRATSGEGQAVLLIGDAGIGKSRLVQATIDAVAGEQHQLLQFQCSPQHAGAALWPVVRHVAHEAGISAADDEATKLGRIEMFIAKNSQNSGAAVPLFAGLIGVSATSRYPPLDLSPAQLRARTLAALASHVRDLALCQPVLIVFEDVHWIDPSSLEFLIQVLDGISNQRVMVVMTSRQDGQLALEGHPDVTRLSLNRLGRGAAESIANRIGGVLGLPPYLLRDIIDRADGVPLYIEELTKAVVEPGASRNAVPASLHASLMARLDRARGVKEMAQLASCIGREFSYDLLAAVSPLPESELDAALDRLIAAEIIFRRPGAVSAYYVFKHMLVRDAAHESLLRKTRRQLHAKIADAIEARLSDVVLTEPELLAEHCAEAGLAEREVDYRLAAGKRSLARSATSEAIMQIEKGLGAIQRAQAGPARDARELKLRLALGQASIAARGFASEAAGDAYARAHALCVATGDGSELAPILYGRSVFHFQRGEIGKALELAENLLALGQARGDGPAEITGLRMIGSALSQRGEIERSVESFEAALALCTQGRDHNSANVFAIDSCAMSLGWLAQLELQRGRAATARSRYEKSALRARSVGHANTSAVTRVWGCIYLQLSHDVPNASTEALEAISLSEAHGYPLYRAAGSVIHGWTLAREGRAEEGILALRRGLADYAATGAKMWNPYFLGLLAEVEGWASGANAGLAVIEKALRQMESTGARWIAADLLRIRGDLLASAGGASGSAEAEASYAEAMHTAELHGAHLWRLRAATGLARLWRGSEASARRRRLLEPIIARFPEPLNTFDDASAAEAIIAK